MWVAAVLFFLNRFFKYIWYSWLVDLIAALETESLLNVDMNAKHCCNRVLHSTTSQFRPFSVSEFAVFWFILFLKSSVAFLNASWRNFSSSSKFTKPVSKQVLRSSSVVECTEFIQASLDWYSVRKTSSCPSFRSTSPFQISFTECCKDSLTSVPSSLSQNRPFGLLSVIDFTAGV